MVESRRRLGFLDEPRLGRRVARQQRGQELERDGPFEAGVTSLIDLTHPSGADRLDDLVLAEAGPRR